MSDNKFMFSAKRLDTGEMTTGRLVYGINGIGRGDAISVFDEEAGVSYERLVDPSTIKPLFTTDKPDLWLFENVDSLPLNKCGDKIQLVIESDDEDLLYFCDGEWCIQSDLISGELRDVNRIYRVKAAVYSKDDAMTEARNSTEESGVFESEDMVILARDVKDIINKLAKANGLGGNDEG